MNSELNNFFKEEQKRVFEPGPYFTQRVMARLASGKALVPTIWDFLPSATRPVVAIALTLLFAVLAVQILAPAQPQHSAIEAYLKQDLSPREQMLIVDPQSTAGASQSEELMLLDPIQLEPMQ